MNIVQKIEQDQLDKLTAERAVPAFQAGDTVRVHVRIIEGATERVQVFEGICIARRNRGINSSFTVRKISHGEGVERIFPLYSPRLEKIEVVRRGDVRRAKLYYLRGLTGKAARIREKMDFTRMGKKAAAKAEAAKTEAPAKADAAKAEAKPAKKSTKKADK